MGSRIWSVLWGRLKRKQLNKNPSWSKLPFPWRNQVFSNTILLKTRQPRCVTNPVVLLKCVTSKVKSGNWWPRSIVPLAKCRILISTQITPRISKIKRRAIVRKYRHQWSWGISPSKWRTPGTWFFPQASQMWSRSMKNSFLSTKTIKLPQALTSYKCLSNTIMPRHQALFNSRTSLNPFCQISWP